MQGPFIPFHYSLKVITPVFIGAAKESDYALGEDYFFEDETEKYVFVHQRAFQKLMSNQELASYAACLANNKTAEAEKMLKRKAQKNPELIWHKSYCPFLNESRNPYDTIRKHTTDIEGHILLPGSSLKGAIRSVIGKYMMKLTGANDFDDKKLFGTINSNFMRFLQISDVNLKQRGSCVPMKIFSGDIDGSYPGNFDGYGAWKHSRVGRHFENFQTDGFVTLFETAPVGAVGDLRINWGDPLLSLMNNIAPEKKPMNATHLSSLSGHKWLEHVRKHTREYLERERAFFEMFPNDDFSEALELVDQLIQENNDSNGALLRLGSGSGYHSITGDWKYPDHTKTEPAHGGGALKYKTRKVAFTGTHEGADRLYFPGFVKISIAA